MGSGLQGLPQGPMDRTLSAPYVPGRGQAELAPPLSPLPTCCWAERPKYRRWTALHLPVDTLGAPRRRPAGFVLKRKSWRGGAGMCPPVGRKKPSSAGIRKKTEPKVSGVGQCVLKAGSEKADRWGLWGDGDNYPGQNSGHRTFSVFLSFLC